MQNFQLSKEKDSIIANHPLPFLTLLFFKTLYARGYQLVWLLRYFHCALAIVFYPRRQGDQPAQVEQGMKGIIAPAKWTSMSRRIFRMSFLRTNATHAGQMGFAAIFELFLLLNRHHQLGRKQFSQEQGISPIQSNGSSHHSEATKISLVQ